MIDRGGGMIVVRILAEAAHARRLAFGPGLPPGLEERLRAAAAAGAGGEEFELLVVAAEVASPEGVVPVGDPAALPRARRTVAVLTLRGAAAPPLLRALPAGAHALRVDRLVTDLAVLDATPRGLVVRELAPGVTAREVQAASEAPLFAEPGLDEMAR